MISQTFRFSLTVALVAAMMAAVVLLLALGHSQAGTSQAGGSDGAMAVDCDLSQSGVQSECSYATGATFQVEVRVTQPPTSGYFQVQAKLGWTEGVVNYLPTSSPADEALWSNCTIAARVNNWVDVGVASVFIACAPLPALPEGDTFTGAVFTFEFQCKSSPQAGSRAAGLAPHQSVLDLFSNVDEPEPAQGGTIFVDASLQPIAPALAGATVTCGEAPPPAPTPVIITPGIHTPTPQATPNASGAMAVDCDASQGGVQANCAYPPGTTFQVEVHVTQPPEGGYFQIQAKLGWTEGVVNYLPAGAQNEALWSNCTIAAGVDNWADVGVPSLFIACAPLPALPEGDTFTGAVFTFELQCKASPEAVSPPAGLAPNQSVLDLISSVNEPDPAQGGTIFVGAGLQPIAPALADATVTCGDEPAPTPTPLSPPATTGSINGTVTAEDTGAPLADICITLDSFEFHAHADTDASGDYTASGLPSGEYAVQFSDCNFPSTYVPEWYDDQPDFDSADLVAVTQGEKTEGIDAALSLGGSINGTVTDEETGTPLAEICVDVFVDASFSFFGFAFTDASGNYSVAGLPSGDYTVGFFDCGFPATHLSEWYDDQPDQSSAHPVAVIQGEKTEGIDAALALGGSINGTVTDEETGTPLAGICVEVLDSSFSFFGFGLRGHGAGQSTDDSGNYSVGGLASGEYKVGFFDCSFPVTYLTEFYDDQPDLDTADVLAITQGEKTEGIDAALGLGGSINGTVTAEGTGAPLAEICVFVQDPTFTFFGFAFTDASGSYSVGGLTSGDYTVQFSDCEEHSATVVTEWYDDQPTMASADLVAITQGVKTEGIDAAMFDPNAPTPTPTTAPGALVFVGEVAVTDPDCGGGDISITLDPAGTEVVSLALAGFNGLGDLHELVLEFDPAIAIASDGSFSGSAPLPPPRDATFEGTFDFGANPTTVSGTLSVTLVDNPGIVLCAADFTAEGPPTETPATPTPGGPAATATPDGDSSVQEATVDPSLPETGAGALAAERGAGAGVWATIGTLLATAAVALALSGWRYVRTP